MTCLAVPANPTGHEAGLTAWLATRKRFRFRSKAAPDTICRQTQSAWRRSEWRRLTEHPRGAAVARSGAGA